MSEAMQKIIQNNASSVTLFLVNLNNTVQTANETKIVRVSCSPHCSVFITQNSAAFIMLRFILNCAQNNYEISAPMRSAKIEA